MRALLRRAALAVVAQALLAQSVTAQGGAPVPDGFHYYWPGQCMEAVYRSDGHYWRARQDTTRFDPAADTMLTTSAALARECAAKFSGAALQARDLIPLAQLYLAAGDDSAAARAAARRLAEPDAKPVAARAWILADIVDAYLRASPARVDAAGRWLRQLDALEGSGAALGKVRAYSTLAFQQAGMGADSASVAAAESAIAAGKQLGERDRREYAQQLFAMYMLVADVAAERTGDAAEPKAVMARARADLGPLRSVDGSITDADDTYALLGTRATPITATRWIGTPGDTVSPIPGRQALVVFLADRNDVPAFRRLAQSFTDRLQIVYVQGSYGYFRAAGPLSFAEEIEEIRKYYLQELRFPGSIAISEADFFTIPDGRRIRRPTVNERAYHIGTGTTVIYVDDEGIIRRIWRGWQPVYELEIERAARRWGT